MIGERIKRARLAAGLSQREAANRAELSAMAISKFERGQITPTSATLIRLARAFNTRTEYFLRPDSVSFETPHFRKRSSLGAKQLVRIEADILEQVERFMEVVHVFPRAPVDAFVVPDSLPPRVDSFDTVEQIAEALRDAWLLGRDAIPSLADALEENGFLVLTTDADSTSKFDGLAATVGGFPLVVVGESWPGDRQRFTMAHELAHIVLAGRLASGIDQEKACDRFAGAFLTPRESVVFALGEHRSRIEPRELYDLKHEYGLSMMAWVFRARDTGVISSTTAESLFRLFSRRGWRKQEPGDSVPSDAPKLLRRLVLRALAEEMVSTSKAAELMGESLGDFRHNLNLEGLSGGADQ